MAVYLDHNASTPLDPRVLEAMAPFLRGPYGNPSSAHRHGRAARDAIETARAQMAALVTADPGEVIFTSGGTEANNFAVKGVAAKQQHGRLLYSAIEHPSVLEPLQALARQGRAVETIAVDAEGRVDEAAFQQQLRRSKVALVSCMVANNETGVIQNTTRLAMLARAAGAVFHADAVQALGKIPLDFAASGAQLLSVSSHKIYGPKGAGALIADRALELEPLLHGGGQERGLRGGTENVAAIAGFGAAAELAGQELDRRKTHTRHLRERLETALMRIPGIRIFSAGAIRLPNTVQFAVPSIHSATLLGLLDKKGFAVSSGSACASGSDQASHVLLAMGVPQDVALCAIRVSVGKDNTQNEVDQFVETLCTLMAGLGVTLPSVALS
ncbi:MAG: cysteine desulfurase [Nevskiales bacterium]|nr:cysteine desulfurase [Nevskiales bacterium]